MNDLPVLKNAKYHLFNIAAVILFSYTTAVTVSDTVEAVFLKPSVKKRSAFLFHRPVRSNAAVRNRAFRHYEESLLGDKGFFNVAAPPADNDVMVKATVDAQVHELHLLGTITGPSSIARAIIRKGKRSRYHRRRRYRRRRSRRRSSLVLKKEEPKEVFKLWEKVYGYRLIGIRSTSVVLKGPEGRAVLKLFEKKDKKSSRSRRRIRRSGNTVTRNLSRAELKQKLKNNMDNAFRGLVVGPYRRNGKIIGFRLKKVRPYNIFYKMGARSGDIILRFNGKKVNSTQKVFNFWKNFSKQSRVEIDLKRRNRMMKFKFNITD